MSSVPTPPSSASAVDVMAQTFGEVLLSVKDLSLVLGGNQILKDLSFEVRDRTRPGVVTGQLVGLLGPSGVGKSQLFRILAGLSAPASGEVRGHKGAALHPGDVGYIFQNYTLLRHRTVLGNLVQAGRINGLSAKDAKARALALLDRFRLADRASFYPAQLSGGQRQRIAIAQQLVVPKKLLLMDEPFSGLDPAALEDVIKLVVEVAHMDELNTVMVVTHDIRAVIEVSDRLLMLGRTRTAEGAIVPGAKIVDNYDLVERGLAWRAGIAAAPEFMALEREIASKFRNL